MKHSQVLAAAAAWTTTLAWGTTLLQAAAATTDPAVVMTSTRRRLRGGASSRAIPENVAHNDITSNTATDPNADDETIVARHLQGSCVLEGNLFGSGQGIFRAIDFRYQGVFQDGTSTTQIIRDILPPFERELTEGILPDFFACPTDQPTGVITTLSPLEDDTLVGGGKFSS